MAVWPAGFPLGRRSKTLTSLRRRGRVSRFALREAEADKLARVLAGELPQTIALVLSHLPPQQAGAVLARLQPALQTDVVHRLVDLEETDPEILRAVEETLEARLSKQVQMQRRRVAGLAAVAGILQASDGRASMQILDNLTAHDRQLAERLTPRPLAFEDLVDADHRVLAARGRYGRLERDDDCPGRARNRSWSNAFSGGFRPPTRSESGGNSNSRDRSGCATWKKRGSELPGWHSGNGGPAGSSSPGGLG